MIAEVQSTVGLCYVKHDVDFYVHTIFFAKLVWEAKSFPEVKNILKC